MRGFAGERDTVAAKTLRSFDREQEHAARVFDGDLAEDRMRAPLDLGRQRWRVESAQPLRLSRINDADEARPQAG